MTDRPALHPPPRGGTRRPGWRFLLAHPAHLLALGFGSGLSPVAPGTAGTLWAWFVFVALQPALGDGARAVILIAATLIGWWACTVTARHLGQADPSAIVWDEVVAFWLMLWLLEPAGWMAQSVAFVLFRIFDAAKPGPVAWADRLFKVEAGGAIGWAQGFGILFDDFVAAGCSLLVIAAWHFAVPWFA
ncbi:MAG: phosphatidylglycerophosphatase A [Pseudomonadota bacterium]|nr:phosphatidylglycerophosphatase A [Pseudomonadota bacterium]